MALLQPKLNLKVSQKQILTPGLVQMVSVLALNKLELADMINAELMENPVLEELDSSVPLLDEVSAREEQKERDSSAAAQEQPAATTEEKDPFEEIDFGSFFSEYLDPGLRTSIEMEDSEKPSFENFLSKPSNLTDHLMWQLGSLHVNEDVYRAAELVIGNLNEEGYLTATDDELLGLAEEDAPGTQPAAAGPETTESPVTVPVAPVSPSGVHAAASDAGVAVAEAVVEGATVLLAQPEVGDPGVLQASAASTGARPTLVPRRTQPARVPFSRDALREAIDLVKQMDPIGVGARDLRECLL
ncbi:MAG TPA: RNA polymerase sigma-54 factor, partial [Chloroflexota bacterium]|nr:RNA polymerase sigma-54 factor [Chloroflexota bacterium]